MVQSAYAAGVCDQRGWMENAKVAGPRLADPSGARTFAAYRAHLLSGVEPLEAAISQVGESR